MLAGLKCRRFRRGKRCNGKDVEQGKYAVGAEELDSYDFRQGMRRGIRIGSEHVSSTYEVVL